MKTKPILILPDNHHHSLDGFKHILYGKLNDIPIIPYQDVPVIQGIDFGEPFEYSFGYITRKYENIVWW